MSGFKPYPAYKDSGVEWLGEVPEHWVVTKFSRHFSVRMGETIPETELSEEGWLPVYSATERDKFYGYVDERKPLVESGDLVIPARGNSIGFVKLVKTSATATQTTIVANVLDHKFTESSYVYYWCLGLRRILFYFDRTAIPQITTEYVSRNPLLLPTLAEQTQIARFLDHETARIDALIEEQQRLIELLKEKRQAVISHAVTKGLDPTVPMKDSGVEWLGEVPVHWALVPFGLAFEYQEGPGIMAVDFRDEGVPLVRISGVQGRWVTLEGCNYLEPSKVKEKWAHFRLDKGDLIISGSASMGLVSEVGEDAAGAVAYTGLIRLKPRANVSIRDFIRSVVGSYQFHAQIDLLKAGSTIQHFGPTHLSQMKVVLPPVNEQAQIAAYVDTISVQFDELLGEAEDTNALLQERRSALISAAVTGKIDVRGWQPPASAQAPTLAAAEAH